MKELEHYNDSEVVLADPVRLEGLWIHDPINPSQTSVQFRYGKDSRGYSIDVGGSTHFFAGREFPVSEFGEHRSDSYSVKVVIPHGPTYHADREALRNTVLTRRTMCFRDNRGVVVYGTVGSLGEDHESHGSVFSFDVTRVHREVFEVG